MVPCLMTYKRITQFDSECRK